MKPKYLILLALTCIAYAMSGCVTTTTTTTAPDGTVTVTETTAPAPGSIEAATAVAQIVAEK